MQPFSTALRSKKLPRKRDVRVPLVCAERKTVERQLDRASVPRSLAPKLFAQLVHSDILPSFITQHTETSRMSLKVVVPLK